jgi:predicted histone-like DNA-binding protein
MITLDAVMRGDPRDQNLPKKWYAKVHTKKTADYRELIERISELSTVNSPDVFAVVESLIKIIPQFLDDGEIVRLGDLGSFTVSVHSEGEDKEEEVDAFSVKRAKIRFVPGKLIKNAINNFEYRRYSQNID